MPKELPKNIGSTPAVFAPVGERVNALLDCARKWENAVGKNGIKVTNSDDSVVIDGSGVSLPAGYTFEEFTICDSGTPATRWIPTWTSNPS